MKKAMCLILCLVFVFSFASCKKNAQETTTNPDPWVIPEESTEPRKNPDEEVTINIPLSLVDKEYQNDLDAYAKKYGYISAKLEKNETVTIKMRALSHSLLLARTGTMVMKEIGAIIDSGDFPYVVQLGTYNRDFSYITLLVKGKEFKKADTSLLPYMLAECGMYYQLFTTNTDYKCEVVIADHESKEVLFQKTYTDEDIQ